MSKLLKSKIVLIGLTLLLGLGIFSGCASKAEEKSDSVLEKKVVVEEAEEDKLEGHVNVVGSTSVTPIAQEMAEAFMAIETGVKVDVQGVGSSAGVKATNDGSADIGMASRNLKTEEKEWEIDEHVIAYDGIAVIVHPSNKVEGLTKGQVTKVFKGEITNWKELGGIDKEILIISREAGSGTRAAFEELMELQEKNAEGKKVSLVKEDALIAEGNGAVKANTAKKEYAIGYLSLSYLDESVKGLLIEGVAPTVSNIVDGKYNISRPFLMLTKGTVSDSAKAYLEFVFSSQGQEIVGKKLIKASK